MRVLITHHFPLNVSPVGRYTYDLALALIASGHDVRCLTVDDGVQRIEPFPVRRVVCSSRSNNVDLPFDVPCFVGEASARLTFAGLTDEQLAQYREQLRRALDAEVSQFDPQIIHTQHVWVMGQLAVEAGVPYVATAWGPELEDAAADPRYGTLAQQAAENAGRILVGSVELGRRVSASFGIGADELALVSPAVGLSYRREPLVSRQSLFSRLGIPLDLGPLVVVNSDNSLDGGIETALNAAARYETALPDATTVLVGSEGGQCEWRALAERIGLKRAIWLAEPAREEFDALLQAARLFVVPDQAHRGGLPAVEAMAAGTPVIATDRSGAAEVVRPEFGAVVASGDHELLADSILRAIHDDWKRTRGPAAVEYVRTHHGMAQCVDSVATIYEAVFRQRYGHAPA